MGTPRRNSHRGGPQPGVHAATAGAAKRAQVVAGPAFLRSTLPKVKHEEWEWNGTDLGLLLESQQLTHFPVPEQGREEGAVCLAGTPQSEGRKGRSLPGSQRTQPLLD